MKITYWQAESKDIPGAVMALRAKTRKALLEQIKDSGSEYFAPEKIVLEYKDAFELLDSCLALEPQQLQIN